MTPRDPLLPGQTPIDDLSGLKSKAIRTQAELNAAEAENIRRAVLKYLAARSTRRSAKFDVPWCLRLHAQMFGDVWKWAGHIRTRELNLGSPVHQVPSDLHALIDDLNWWRAHDMPLAEQAARLHHRAVTIHPFLNGNGRWSRLLANIWLRLHDGPVVDWPESTIGSASTIRAEYLAALRAADAGDLAPLLQLHARHSLPTSHDRPR